MPDIMVCSKCLSTMQSVARGGVIIEHCTGCGGVFLDRGELDQLIAAENRYLKRESYGHARPYQHEGRERYDDDYKKKKKRKKQMKGFLEEIFDID